MPNQNNTEQKQSQYGQVFLSDIKRLAMASGGECQVFMVLCVHAFNAERIAFPSTTTMQNVTGLSRTSVFRALRGLKEKGIIQEVGKGKSGVVKYKITSIISDTRTNNDTRTISDTRTNNSTPTRTISGTLPVPNMAPIKQKRNNKIEILASFASYERDVKLFILLWNKWFDSPLCLWDAENPVEDYIAIRKQVLSLWSQQGYKKDLYYEIQVFDVYLMSQQDIICQGQPYVGMPRLWAKEKWKGGLRKWLSSSTKSHLGGNRKSYVGKCITVSNVQFTDCRPVNHSINVPNDSTYTNMEQANVNDLKTALCALANIEAKYAENTEKLHEEYDSFHAFIQQNLDHDEQNKLYTMEQAFDFMYYIQIERNQ